MSVTLRMRGQAFLSSAGQAGPRRLAMIALSGTAIVALVLAVALSGHQAPPESRDARMKPVDPLPGGLHSTPEMNALGYVADTQQAQAALKRAIDESFVSAFRLVSLLGAALALLSALSAWLLVAGKQLEPAGGSASKPQASTAGADEQEPQISAD